MRSAGGADKAGLLPGSTELALDWARQRLRGPACLAPPLAAPPARSCPIRKAGGGVSALRGLLGKVRPILSPEVLRAGTSGVERMLSDVVSGSALTPKCCKEAPWGWCLPNLGNWRIP